VLTSFSAAQLSTTVYYLLQEFLIHVLGMSAAFELPNRHPCYNPSRAEPLEKLLLAP
jgi:hypothetical protein